jgi:hypothetical protein
MVSSSSLENAPNPKPAVDPIPLLDILLILKSSTPYMKLHEMTIDELWMSLSEA